MFGRRLRRFKLLVDAGVFLDLPVFSPPPPPPDYRMRGIAQVRNPCPGSHRARHTGSMPRCGSLHPAGLKWLNHVDPASHDGGRVNTPFVLCTRRVSFAR